MRDINVITGAIIDAALQIHRHLGPGLLESVYDVLLAQELTYRGFVVERQKYVSFEYRGVQFENAFRVDRIVAGLVVVEIKSVERLAVVHEKQLLTYLKLLDLPIGLLLNFGAPYMKDGIKRIANFSSEPQRLRGSV